MQQGVPGHEIITETMVVPFVAGKRGSEVCLPNRRQEGGVEMA